VILQIPCTKCQGQVLERNGLDGQEQICLNCGFGQVQNIIPSQALADESEDYNLRNGGRTVLTKRGLLNRKGNHLGGGIAKAGTKGFQKRVAEPVRNGSKVTADQVLLWGKLSKELDFKKR
jgi:hypothetical protein